MKFMGQIGNLLYISFGLTLEMRKISLPRTEYLQGEIMIEMLSELSGNKPPGNIP